MMKSPPSCKRKIYTLNTDHDNYITMLLKIKEQTVEIDNITQIACYFIESVTTNNENPKWRKEDDEILAVKVITTTYHSNKIIKFIEDITCMAIIARKEVGS